MKLPHRRQFLHLAAGAAALPAASRVALAHDYPTKPVRLIAPFAPGGGTDQWSPASWANGSRSVSGSRSSLKIGRALAAISAPRWWCMRQPTVIRSSCLGLNDAVNATLYDKLNFNFVRDISPVGSVVRFPLVIVVHPSFPSRTVPEFIDFAKANPGKVNMASAGSGSPNHMAGELFQMMTGISLVHVPYRGAGPALSDMLGGQVQVMFATTAAAIEYIKAGKLRALAVTTEMRSAALPEVPTVAEFVPGYEASFWAGVGAPKKTASEIINKLNREINAGLADPTITTKFADVGGLVFAGSPAAFGKLIADESAKWAKVIRTAHIKAG